MIVPIAAEAVFLDWIGLGLKSVFKGERWRFSTIQLNASLLPAVQEQY
jgi:hypothetical protein